MPLRFHRHILRAAFVLALMGAGCTRQPFDPHPPLVSLPEVALFSAGNRVEWAAEDFDDHAWQEVSIGPAWQHYGGPRWGGQGWYRTRFRVSPALAAQSLAVVIGHVGNVSEIFVNGRHVGGYGPMQQPVPGDVFLSDPTSAVPSSGRVHLAVIPAGVLHGDRENVLAIRVRNYLGAAGWFGGSHIGVYEVAAAYRAQRATEALSDMARLAILSLCGVWSLVLVALRVLGATDRAFCRRGAVLGLAWMISNAAQMHVVRDSPQLWAWLSAPFAAALLLLPWLCYRMVGGIRKRPLAAWTDWLMLGCLVLVLLGHHEYHQGRIYSLIPAFQLYCVVAWLCGIGHALVDLRRRVDGAALRLTLSLLLMVFGGLELVAQMTPHLRYATLPVSIADLTMPAFITLAGVFSLRHYRRLRQQTDELQQRVLQGHEEERRRIGHDLHDGLAQDLQALLLRAEMLKAMPAGSTELSQPLADGLRKAVTDVRALAEDLQPVHLREAGSLATALQSLALESGSQVQAQIELTSEPPPRLADTLYRVAQEALGNARRHAQAETIHLSATQDAAGLHLFIRDDGRGFDPAAGTTRLGLRFMQDRVGLVGGRFDITSTPGGGTCIRVDIPLAPSP